MQLQLPLLLDGDTLGAFLREAGPGECVQQWMLRNPAKVSALQSGFVGAGADVLCAPTQGLNPLGLAAYPEQEGQERRLGESVVALTRQSAEGRPVAGSISAAELRTEPFGPLPYTDLIDTYAEQALELRDAGVDLLVLQMNTFLDARASVLGARQSGLPLIVVLELAEQLPDQEQTDPLAALLCLQELGIFAFGVACDSGDCAKIIKRLAPYAKVPLAAQIGAGEGAEACTHQGFEAMVAGARILLGGKDTAPDHVEALARVLQSFDPTAYPMPEAIQSTPLLLCDSTHVYYLEEQHTCSAEITCSAELSADILEAEDTGLEALVFRVRNIKDARRLAQSLHLVHSAVRFVADGEEALEMALLYYNGRALVDRRSYVKQEVLRTLAAGYGAEIR